MISTALARELRDAGVGWAPVSGDAFQLSPAMVDEGDFEGDVFTISDMTIEAHRFATGTVLGFNGTTEWALDLVAQEDALWLPREDQLRDLLRGTFQRLEREADGDRIAYTVTIRLDGAPAAFRSDDPAEAYGRALLALARSAAA